MLSIVVKNRQSLLDIALQETGTIEAAFDIAVANGLSITDYVPGQMLVIPDTAKVDDKILAYYKDNEISPATLPLTATSTVWGGYVDDEYWDDDYTAI